MTKSDGCFMSLLTNEQGNIALKDGMWMRELV